ncbi:MAG: prenyltransferase [Planctomycetes bacterium]|nr:prenyltransferase [Planctomycetota bacterium]
MSLVAMLLSVGLLPQRPEPVILDAQAEPIKIADAEHLRACDAALARGLQWLAARQTPAGAFTGIVGHKRGDDYLEIGTGMPVSQQEASGHGHMGVTALCGMAFLAGGNLPDRGRHGAVVQRTLDYVTKHVHENGYISDAGTRMYSHAFATLFLAEIHGMAGGTTAKDALERAVHLIVDCQNGLGGWRYNPFDRELDLSVTVCQVQALRAARNIGIQVPVATIDAAMDYVKKSRVAAGRYRGLFYYKIHGRGGYEKPTEFAINAAALTALSSAGVYEQELADPVLDFLDREYPQIASWYADHYYFWYGNYYACQAYYQFGGERFRRYFQRVSKDLLGMQQADGRWVDRVGPGDEFSTAVACIVLGMPKHYLPIFQR